MEKITVSLITAAKAENIAPEQIDALQSSFMPFFQQASDWKEKAMAIKVTHQSQKDAIKDARTARLALKGIRVETEKRRKEMKEDSLRKGKAIDGMANVIFYLIEPIEKHLQEQEDFAARLEAKERDEARYMREVEAGPYMGFFPQSIDLGAITDEDFGYLIKGAKLQKQAADNERKRQEEEAAETARKEQEAREAQRLENIRLKTEAEAAEKERLIEREAANKEWRKVQNELDAEREARAKIERKVLSAAEKLQRESEAFEAAQRMESEYAERIAREAAQAPDLDKMRAYAAKIRAIETPDIFSKESVAQFTAFKRFLERALEILEA